LTAGEKICSPPQSTRNLPSRVRHRAARHRLRGAFWSAE